MEKNPESPTPSDYDYQSYPEYRTVPRDSRQSLSIARPDVAMVTASGSTGPTGFTPDLLSKDDLWSEYRRPRFDSDPFRSEDDSDQGALVHHIRKSKKKGKRRKLPSISKSDEDSKQEDNISNTEESAELEDDHYIPEVSDQAICANCEFLFQELLF